MPRRVAFRPTLSDRLEERLALSAPGSAIVHIDGAPSRHGRLIVGAMGDSVTDEYRFDSYGKHGAKNWVEILASTRHTRFGPYSARSLGEPRLAGYAANWARDGATSDDMVRNQLPGLSNQVRSGQVNLVWIFIGANDYFQYASSISPFNPPSPSDSAAALAKIEQRADDNITTAVRTITAANPSAKLVIATLPDLRQIPAAANLANVPALATILDQAAGSIAQYNARIHQLAAQDPTHIAVADLAGLFASTDAMAGPSGKLAFGGKTIDVRTPGNDPTHLFLADGVHIGTVGQGLIANSFVQTANSDFNAGFKPLKPAEILRQAKLTDPSPAN